jgi:hypothetical protein
VARPPLSRPGPNATGRGKRLIRIAARLRRREHSLQRIGRRPDRGRSIARLLQFRDVGCPGMRIHAIDIVQPPGIGIPRIADMDAHQTIVTAALAAKSSAETPKKARRETRSEWHLRLRG